MYKPAIVDYYDIPVEYHENIKDVFEQDEDEFETGNISYEWFPEDEYFNECNDFNKWLNKEYGDCEYYIIET